MMGGTHDRQEVPPPLVELLHALLALVAERGDRELGVLTAEELASITGPAAPRATGRLVPLPQVDELDGATRTAVTTAARRGLAARGLLDADLLDVDPDTPIPLERLGEVLGLIVWLRAAPDALTWAERETAAAATDRVLYGIADLAVLEEASGDEGLHRFTLRSRHGAATALGTFADPDGRAATDGPPVVRRGEEEPPGWDTVARVLDHAESVTRIGTLRPDHAGGDRLALSLVAGPEGLWVVGGSAPPDHGDTMAQVAARPVAPSTLREVLLATIGFADPAVTAADGPRSAVHAPQPDG